LSPRAQITAWRAQAPWLGTIVEKRGLCRALHKPRFPGIAYPITGRRSCAFFISTFPASSSTTPAARFSDFLNQTPVDLTGVLFGLAWIAWITAEALSNPLLAITPDIFGTLR
jgi:hypothetical protein